MKEAKAKHPDDNVSVTVGDEVDENGVVQTNTIQIKYTSVRDIPS